MLRIYPGDAIRISYQGKYYYCIILTKLVLFGGNLIYVFDFETDTPLSLDELIDKNPPGYNAFVDFIMAKREGRIEKIGRVEKTAVFWKSKYFKLKLPEDAKSKDWFIYDIQNTLVKRTPTLTEEEKNYTLQQTMGDARLCTIIHNRTLRQCLLT